MQTPELLSDIEDAIQRLSLEELRAFRRWFAEYDAQQWDAEFERDVAEDAWTPLQKRRSMDTMLGAV